MSKYLIEVPNLKFNGVREGLGFHEGKAETDDKELAKKLIARPDYYCKQLGKPKPQDGKSETGDLPAPEAKAEKEKAEAEAKAEKEKAEAEAKAEKEKTENPKNNRPPAGEAGKK